jgi:hypothetical protein
MPTSLMRNKQAQLQKLSLVFLAAAALFLVTALIMNINTGVSVEQTLPPTGGLVGPLQVDERFTVLEITVTQRIFNNHWSFVTGQLLDANKDYLTGFGDELYHETGYDADGRWVATEHRYDAKLTVRKPGKYYLKFTTDSDARPAQLPPIRVNVEEKLASSIPHFVGGVLLILVGVFMNIKSGGSLTRLFQER